MKNLIKIVLVIAVGFFILGVVVDFASDNNKVFMRTGMAVITGDKVDFEDALTVAGPGQEIWTVKGFGETKDSKKVTKLWSLYFDFSGPGIEVKESTRYVVLDMASYKGGKYTFSNK